MGRAKGLGAAAATKQGRLDQLEGRGVWTRTERDGASGAAARQRPPVWPKAAPQQRGPRGARDQRVARRAARDRGGARRAGRQAALPRGPPNRRERRPRRADLLPRDLKETPRTCWGPWASRSTRPARQEHLRPSPQKWLQGAHGDFAFVQGSDLLLDGTHGQRAWR